MDDVLIVIPARLDSKRFPDKPLAEVEGKSLLWHTFERASGVGCEVVVATGDNKIVSHCLANGMDVYLTQSGYWCGTDRVAEVMEGRPEKNVIVNWQVDEPEASPIDVARAVREVRTRGGICTLYADLWSMNNDDPNVVKVIVGKDGRCHWFTRNWLQESFAHAGVYVFERDVLEQCSYKAQTEYSKAESLEQLTWLENGVEIQGVKTNHARGINTPADLEEFAWRLRNRESRS